VPSKAAATLGGATGGLGDGLPEQRPAGLDALDLGGNVAEWVTGKDGKGLLHGGSADAPS
jgi:hypothetical protein